MLSKIIYKNIQNTISISHLRKISIPTPERIWNQNTFEYTKVIL